MKLTLNFETPTARTNEKDRVCVKCWLRKHHVQFPDDQADTCKDCLELGY